MIRFLLFFAGTCLPWLAIAADFSPIPAVSGMKDVARAPVPFDLVTLKQIVAYKAAWKLMFNEDI